MFQKMLQGDGGTKVGTYTFTKYNDVDYEEICGFSPSIVMIYKKGTVVARISDLYFIYADGKNFNTACNGDSGFQGGAWIEATITNNGFKLKQIVSTDLVGQTFNYVAIK